MEETIQPTLNRLKIDNTDVFLEDYGPNQGKITISDTYGHNYSNYWGSMGGTLKEFLCHINCDYFASKLMGSRSDTSFNAKATFATVRKFIRKELGFDWYIEQEFQKHMREVLNSFQSYCEETKSENVFVDGWHYNFINRLNFWMIKDEWDREHWEKEFKAISEQWHFIQTMPSENYIWLTKFHGRLKKELKK